MAEIVELKCTRENCMTPPLEIIFICAICKECQECCGCYDLHDYSTDEENYF